MPALHEKQEGHMAKPLRRRDPLKEDEVLTFAQQVLEFVRRHRTYFILGVAGVALAFAGSATYQYWQKSRRDTAATALTAVRPKLNQPAEAQEALRSLDNIARQYRSTPAAQEAAFYRGHLLYQLGKYEDSANTYKELLADPAILKEPGASVLITDSLSYCYEGLGKYGEAAQVWQPLVDKISGPFQTDLTLRLAWLYDKAGNYQEAKKYWGKLLENPPSPAIVPYLKEKLADAGPAAKK
jgi:tetratricopeptide (TPR) repeat protein